MEFTAVLEAGEDGWIIATCPQLPGCHTQGKTEAEALVNLREAIAAYLLTLGDHSLRGMTD